MKIIIAIFIASFTFLVVSVNSGPAKVQCYDKATEHYFDAGTEYRPVGQCVKMTCSATGTKSSLICPLNAGGEACTRTPANLRKTYPDCCPKIQCPK